MNLTSVKKQTSRDRSSTKPKKMLTMRTHDCLDTDFEAISKSLKEKGSNSESLDIQKFFKELQKQFTAGESKRKEDIASKEKVICGLKAKIKNMILEVKTANEKILSMQGSKKAHENKTNAKLEDFIGRFLRLKDQMSEIRKDHSIEITELKKRIQAIRIIESTPQTSRSIESNLVLVVRKAEKMDSPLEQETQKLKDTIQLLKDELKQNEEIQVDLLNQLQKSNKQIQHITNENKEQANLVQYLQNQNRLREETFEAMEAQSSLHQVKHKKLQGLYSLLIDRHQQTTEVLVSRSNKIQAQETHITSLKKHANEYVNQIEVLESSQASSDQVIETIQQENRILKHRLSALRGHFKSNQTEMHRLRAKEISQQLDR